MATLGGNQHVCGLGEDGALDRRRDGTHSSGLKGTSLASSCDTRSRSRPCLR